jgi:mRNA interferase HigB
MILIGQKIIVDFGRNHPHSRNPLSAWAEVIKQTDYKSFNELKRTFPSVDYVNHQYTIFDIGGNKYRLITEIDYIAQVVNIKRVWTHAEYSMKKNEEGIKRGNL